MAAWNKHLDSCASCTSRLIEKKAERTGVAADPRAMSAEGTDATVSLLASKELARQLRSVAFSPKGDRIVTAVKGDEPYGDAQVWHVAEGEDLEPLFSLRGHDAATSTALRSAPTGSGSSPAVMTAR